MATKQKFLLKLLLLLNCSLALASKNYHPKLTATRPNDPRFKSQRDIDDDEDASYWLETGKDSLEESLQIVETVMPTHAKNVIIFVGDGMSENTVTAARIYKAQQAGNFDNPESQLLAMESLDHVALSKTYDIDATVPDSAATATALFSGVKTNTGVLGFDMNVAGPETMDPSIEVTTMLTWAQQAGMDTGLISTARVTHATPAALYSHVYTRGWECDSDYDEEEPPPEGYSDIASQLIFNEPGMNTKVIMGGGYPAFFPVEYQHEIRQNLTDAYGFHIPWDCWRSDGQNLIDEWLAQKGDGNARFIMTQDELNTVVAEETDYLFGLFGASHMTYDHHRKEGRDPSISEMTEKAIQILQKGENGFFLMVEGGRIDHAHHGTMAKIALSETAALDDAVAKAVEVLGDDLENTLIIVTADHSHTITISGYPARGNVINGLSGELDDDNLPYTTLSYANGHAFYIENLPPEEDSEDQEQIHRRDLNDGGLLVDVESYLYWQTSAGPIGSETHGGDDVLIFANGPAAHLFHQTHEQTHIANVMAYAACVGQYSNIDPEDPLCEARKI